MNVKQSMRFLVIVALLVALAAALVACGNTGGGPSQDTSEVEDVVADVPAVPDAREDVAIDAADTVSSTDVAVPSDAGDVVPDVEPDVRPDAADAADAVDAVDVEEVDVPPACSTECCSDADCEDGDTCTLDRCGEDGTCQPPEVLDCDDDDDCTTDGCSADGACTHDPVPDCCAFTPLADVPGAVMKFEGEDLAGWGIEDRALNTRPAEDPWDEPVVWHVDAGRAFDGAGALYFGSPSRRTYDNGRRVSAAATSPDLLLPADVTAELRLRVWMHAEERLGYDAFDVAVVVPGAGPDEADLRVPVWTKPSDFPLRSWERVVVDLAAFRGRTIRIELLFDSVDGSTNRFEGVYVDDLAVGTRCAPAACVADADCDDGVVCTTPTCADGGCAFDLGAGCCATAVDCADGDACSLDRCIEGVCSNVALPIADCCNTDADCADDDPCTAARCEANVCERYSSGAAGCCASDDDCADEIDCTETRCNTGDGSCRVLWACECRYDARCDDGDHRCTEDRCVAGVCLNTPNGPDDCCSNEVFVDHFQDPAVSRNRWTFSNASASVGWNFWDGPASESTALYFGNPATGNYSTGQRVSGTALTAPITLPRGVPFTLSFDLYLAIESGVAHDTFRVLLLHEGDTLALFVKDFQTQTYTWETVQKDLSGFAGETIQFRFEFDSQDGEGNDGEGVYVDEFALTSSCRGRACDTPTDCFDGFGATRDLCVSGICQYRLQESLCDTDEQCNDVDVCTRDRCVLGGCTFERIQDCCRSTADCDDRNVCTTDTCEGTNPPLCQHRRTQGCCINDRECDDGNACTEDVCPGEGLFCDNPLIEDCCLLNTQCADGDPCTRDQCVGNACQNLFVCCESSAECDDQDACTIDSCIDGRCVFDVDAETAGCCEGTRVIAGFESGTLEGFEVSGGTGTDAWRVLEPSAGSHGGSWALYYGDANGSAYASNSSGTARSPAIPLPGGQELELSFWVKYDTESCCDELMVYLEARGEDIFLGEYKGSGGWIEVATDVSFLAGSTARLRFDFGTDGSVTRTGVWVDDIEVHSTCTRPPCADAEDCDAPVGCIERLCLGGGCVFEQRTDCCQGVADCGDGDPCTADACVNEVCEFTPIEGCCRAAADCESASECVVGACVANRCRLACDPTCENCCLERRVCDDGERCTTDDCQANECTHDWICCAGDGECDDGDDVCTTDSCAGGFCRFLIDPAVEGCCNEQTVLGAFEGGDFGGFTFAGNLVGGDVWHVHNDLGHSGIGSLHYGAADDGDYHNSSQGTATSPSYFVPPGQEIELSFWFFRDMEGCCDHFKAFVVVDGQSFQLGDWNDDPGVWEQVTWDVTWLAGREFQLRFEFTSDSSVTYPGVWVDDIELVSTCAPRSCEADTDCTAPTGCVDARCLGATCDYQPRTDCCQTTAQCDDQNPCTTDGCVNEACVHEVIPGCCLADSDCEDGNACTVNACISGTCQIACDPVCDDCCLTVGDCGDGESCTTDRCNDHACSYTWVCCESDADCDDGDDICTTDRCIDQTCAFILDASNPDCCSFEPFAFDFEDGTLGAFVASAASAGGDRWQVVQGTAHTGGSSLYYGHGGAYANDSLGTVTSPAFQLPLDEELTLSFWFKRNMESCCDHFRVHLDVAGVSFLLGDWNGDADWTEVTADVSEAAGQTVQLRFEFDSDSSVTDVGVYVDDITVASTCAPVACETDGDCWGHSGCIDWACVDGGCASTVVANCCQADAECDDGSACTIDLCTEQRCSNTLDPAQPGCCTLDEHCDDGNVCTDDVCGGELCIRACAGGCPYDYPWSDDFTTAVDFANTCWEAAEGSRWSLDTSGAGSSPRLVFDGSAAPAVGWEDCVLSPTIDSHRALTAAFTFWHRLTATGATDATLSARMTTDDGDTWEELWAADGAAGNATGRPSIDVFAAVQWQPAVRVAFCVESKAGGPAPILWLVDEVALTGDAFEGEPPEWADVPPGVEASVGSVTTFDVIASDIDDDPLAITLGAGAPSFVSIEDHGDGTATVTVAPLIGDDGEYTLTVEVFDTWLTIPADVPLTVVVPGVAPVVEPIPDLRVVPETVRNVRLLATDADDQPLSWTITGAPAFVTLRDAGDGTALLSVKPRIADIGEYSLALTLSDTTRLVDIPLPLVVGAPGDAAPIVEDFEAGGDLAALGWEARTDPLSADNDWALAAIEGDKAALFVDFPIVSTFDDLLVSPLFDATGLATVAVRWTGYFRDYPLETADPVVRLQVLASANGGETWTSIWTWPETGGDLPRGPHEVDASAVVAGSATARIAFRISGGTTAALLSWEVDDVIVWGAEAP